MDGGKKRLLEVMRRRRRRRRRRGKGGEERRRRMPRDLASRAHAPRVRAAARVISSLHTVGMCAHACVRVGTYERTGGTYVLRRSSNTRANRPGWRYRVSNGPNVRKSPVGAVSRVFLTESSRTRAAGNSIRCPCTAGTVSLSLATARGQRAPSAGSPTYHTPALWEPFQRARQVGMTARGNARGVLLEPEEPAALPGPCALGPRAGQIRLLRTWGASFAFLEDGRPSSRFLLFPANNF